MSGEAGQNLDHGRSLFVGRLYAIHGDALRIYIRSNGVREAEVEDILHDVFLRLLRQEELAARAQNIRAYMYQVVRNILCDRARSKAVRRPFDGGLADQPDRAKSDVPAPDHRCADAGDVDVLKRALARLDDKPRLAFLLARVEEVPYREIGRRLGVSTRSVERYVSQCLEYLRQELKR